MAKISFQRLTTKRIQMAAPWLRYAAFYHAEEDRLSACMRDYADRSFVYILSSMHEGEEYFLYVGKSKAQYARYLAHAKKYAYDHIYLFECEPGFLAESEAAVIAELCPIFNRKNNPLAQGIYSLLEIDYDAKQDKEMIRYYLERYARYRNTGLYGFALPVVVFSALKKMAGEEKRTCSELIQEILEKELKDKIEKELEHLNSAEGKTNLITAKSYGKQHEKSTEQIKQYLRQANRLPGSAKIGRDWVLPQDTRFPEDLRGKCKSEDGRAGG